MITRIPAAAALVAIALLAAGCASTPPASAPTKTAEAAPTPSASATPVVEELEAPYPAIEISCADFELEAAASDALGKPAKLVEDLVEHYDREDQGPDSFAVEFAGGIRCLWLAGDRSIYLALLPEPGTLWNDMGGYYSPSSSKTQRSCDNPTNCMADPLTPNDIWISMSLSTIEGGSSIDKWDVIVDSAIATVSAAKPASPEWKPQSDFAIDADCGSLISDAEATAAFGSSAGLLSFTRHGGWSLEASASVLAPVHYCLWGEGNDTAVGHIDAIAGGEWAWEQVSNRSGALDRKPLEITGLADSDSAWITCDYPVLNRCSGDLLVGGNWISVTSYPENPGAPEESVKKAIQAIVDNLA